MRQAVQFRNTRTGDIVTVFGPNVVHFDGKTGWERHTSDTTDLKGKALDQALADAGLPQSGTADEKRARLAEHDPQGSDE